MNHKISYKDIKQFSKLVLDYIQQNEKLEPFINHFPKIENFGKQIIEKKKQPIDRNLLVHVLKEQNQCVNLSKLSKINITSLKDTSTFSVSTGHQICLFTGPLYFLYKIISTINLCEQLNQKYVNNHFVPIFWMATEDHDFNEINHVNLFGHKVEWHTKQSGAVGKMSLDNFDSVISELKLVLGSHRKLDKIIFVFEQAYLENKNLADATRYLLNELFGFYGLVIVDGNERNLKKCFIPQMKRDIIENRFSSMMRQCSSRLSKHYKVQAYVRDINFFRLLEGKRELINKSVSEREIEDNPEFFSPNVLLRPLYQEIVLPNIAYVGGGAEVSYWMQLKTVFEQEKIPFPILVLRNSALLINAKQKSKFENLGFKLEDIFLTDNELYKRYIFANNHLEICLDKDKEDLNLLYQNLLSKTVDSSLQESIRAQLKKQISYFDVLQTKIIRSEKKKNQIAINQIAKIKKQLFPNNMLQERYDNLIVYYLEYGDNFIKTLKNNFDPLNANFVILSFKN